jgi:hypothetical protein
MLVTQDKEKGLLEMLRKDQEYSRMKFKDNPAKAKIFSDVRRFGWK